MRPRVENQAQHLARPEISKPRLQPGFGDFTTGPAVGARGSVELSASGIGPTGLGGRRAVFLCHEDLLLFAGNSRGVGIILRCQ